MCNPEIEFEKVRIKREAITLANGAVYIGEWVN